MPWRWKEPGRKGQKSPAFATKDMAIKNAVHFALVVKGAKAREIADDLIPGLWRSMMAKGWAVYEDASA